MSTRGPRRWSVRDYPTVPAFQSAALTQDVDGGIVRADPEPQDVLEQQACAFLERQVARGRVWSVWSVNTGARTGAQAAAIITRDKPRTLTIRLPKMAVA